MASLPVSPTQRLLTPFQTWHRSWLTAARKWVFASFARCAASLACAIDNIDNATHPHAMNPSINGNVFNGLPVTGFEAVNFVNGNLGGVLANYSGVYRHREARNCTNAGGVGNVCS